LCAYARRQKGKGEKKILGRGLCWRERGEKKKKKEEKERVPQKQFVRIEGKKKKKGKKKKERMELRVLAPGRIPEKKKKKGVLTLGCCAVDDEEGKKGKAAPRRPYFVGRCREKRGRAVEEGRAIQHGKKKEKKEPRFFYGDGREKRKEEGRAPKYAAEPGFCLTKRKKGRGRNRCAVLFWGVPWEKRKKGGGGSASGCRSCLERKKKKEKNGLSVAWPGLRHEKNSMLPARETRKEKGKKGKGDANEERTFSPSESRLKKKEGTINDAAREGHTGAGPTAKPDAFRGKKKKKKEGKVRFHEDGPPERKREEGIGGPKGGCLS